MTIREVVKKWRPERKKAKAQGGGREMNVQMICAICGKPSGVIKIESPDDYENMVCQKCFLEEVNKP
jgi:DNA-directed RNA polymerase subunit RPC12/RpoP